MQHLCTTDPDIALARRFNGNFRLLDEDLSQQTQRLQMACVVDTETSGLGRHDKAIEIAVLPFAFDRVTGRLVEVFAPVVELQDPGVALSPEVQEITGLTDLDVRGKVANWARLHQAMSNCHFVIAHNARFDRPMVHRGFASVGKSAPKMPWVCSMSDIDWKKEPTHPPAVALGALAAWYGFFFDAHRALSDCKATLHLLDLAGKMRVLAERARTPVFLVTASGKLFAANELLKDRSYRWNSDKKYWWLEVPNAAAAAAERQWLQQNVYVHAVDESEAITVTPEERFL